jgi:hypothetical protein
MKTQQRLFPVVVIVASLANPSAASAQSTTSRFELGAQFSTLWLSDFDATSAGLGGRLSYDFASWATAEGEFSFFPSNDIGIPDLPFTVGGEVRQLDLRITHRRRRAEGFFGPKLGLKAERFGVFAKVRPGFTHISLTRLDCAGVSCAIVRLVQPVYRTEFAMDLGAVLEFYPSPRTAARLDLGDTWVRHRSSAPPCWGEVCTSHNFASRLGIGLRF